MSFSRFSRFSPKSISLKLPSTLNACGPVFSTIIGPSDGQVFVFDREKLCWLRGALLIDWQLTESRFRVESQDLRNSSFGRGSEDCMLHTYGCATTIFKKQRSSKAESWGTSCAQQRARGAGIHTSLRRTRRRPTCHPPGCNDGRLGDLAALLQGGLTA